MVSLFILDIRSGTIQPGCMRLPIPIFSKDRQYTEAEIEPPSAGTIASTVNTFDKGGGYQAIVTWLAGSVVSLSADGEEPVTDPARLKSLIQNMPYKTAEFLMAQSLLLIHDDDAIEGVYRCPRCSTQVIAEVVEDEGLDTADYLSALEVHYQDEYSNGFEHSFVTPVEIKDRAGQVTQLPIEHATWRYPTLQDCINAYTKGGARDGAKLQYRIYLEALLKVNMEEVDNKWKNLWGMPFMNSIRNFKQDLQVIFHKGREYGYVPDVEKSCPNCGKVWREPVNPMNFFASALRSVQ